jgi:hypothetical protein
MARNEQPTPRAYRVTLTWSTTVTVIALSETDARMLAASEVSSFDIDESADVENEDDCDLEELDGDDPVFVADLSAAGIDKSDLPHETEDAWGEWAREGGLDSARMRAKKARRVIGADPSAGQLAAMADDQTGDLFAAKGGA